MPEFNGCPKLKENCECIYYFDPEKNQNFLLPFVLVKNDSLLTLVLHAKRSYK